MASVKIYGMDGAEQGTVDLNEAIFDVAFNSALVHDAVVALQNARRQGNADTKTRKEVRGGGKKPFRQKGTGRARQGSSREPQMRGGGTVFGPHPRSYRQNVPVSVRRKALCCALSDRVRGEQFAVLATLSCETPKTKPFAAMMARLSPDGRKTLIVTDGMDPNVMRSARNLPKVTLRTAADVNVLDVLNANRVVVVQDALPALEERLT
jgi:large subunit ribosomal protein L4